MKLSLNVGGWDRNARLILGVALIALAYFDVLTGTAAIIAYVVGGIGLVTGFVSYCPANTLFGINTRKGKSSGTAD